MCVCLLVLFCVTCMVPTCLHCRSCSSPLSRFFHDSRTDYITSTPAPRGCNFCLSRLALLDLIILSRCTPIYTSTSVIASIQKLVIAPDTIGLCRLRLIIASSLFLAVYIYIHVGLLRSILMEVPDSQFCHWPDRAYPLCWLLASSHFHSLVCHCLARCVCIVPLLYLQ